MPVLPSPYLDPYFPILFVDHFLAPDRIVEHCAFLILREEHVAPATEDEFPSIPDLGYFHRLPKDIDGIDLQKALSDRRHTEGGQGGELHLLFQAISQGFHGYQRYDLSSRTLCLSFPTFGPMGKKALVTVINDLATDQRVDRICRTLREEGYDVLLIGRRLKKSPPLPERPYAMHRMKLPFEKGPLFYLSFMMALFPLLLRRSADLIWANDLDTLGPAYGASRWKRIPLIYDSHEYFTEVPELEGKRIKKGIWRRLEASIIPKLPFMLTVNPSIAEKYRERYDVPVHVLPNHPEWQGDPDSMERQELDLPEDRFILILQGSGINLGRGGEELIEAVKQLEGVLLLIIGGGDRYAAIREKADPLVREGKVRFLSRMPYSQMMQYTRNADLGLSLDRPLSENYRLSTPNKLFDYIHAGTPVLASDLPEVGRIVKDHGVGELTDPSDPDGIARSIRSLMERPQDLKKYRENARRAGPELDWEKTGKPVIRETLRKAEAGIG
jgi:glycosyltransferase involved in cell wall biosynthesis